MLIRTLLLLILIVPALEAKSTIVGDIILQGSVEKSGQKLTNDSSIFEGDSIRTQKASGGIMRIGRGRVEIGESSEVEIVRGNPVKIVVKSGSIAFNFPRETAVEIITPQLEVRPGVGQESLSGVVTATPQTEDRVVSRSGKYTILERQKDGATRYINAGQALVATLVPTAALTATLQPDPAALPQGPIGGPQIAILDQASGDVRVARNAIPNNFTRIAGPTPRLPLASGDFVRTLNGQANVTFNDNSIITLNQGTTIQIQEQMRAGTVSRRITQAIGNLWFRIQSVTGTQTTLETPTAVAAIRGTEGTQDVPNNIVTDYALNEGIEEITEVVTQQSVTIRSGQRVRAMRGIGFGPVVALLAAIAQPAIGAGGGGGAGGGAGGGGAGAGGGAAGGGAGAGAGGTAGGAAGGAAAGAATTAATTTVSAVTTAAAVAAAAVVPVATTTAVLARNDKPTASPSTLPLNPPGGG